MIFIMLRFAPGAKWDRSRFLGSVLSTCSKVSTPRKQNQNRKDSFRARLNRSLFLSFPRPLLENPCPLPDRQPDPRPMLDCLVEQLTSLFEVVAGIKEAVDLHAVLRPLLDLVEIAMMGMEWVIGFFVGPVAHRTIFFRSAGRD
jgi:hypothetical protein